MVQYKNRGFIRRDPSYIIQRTVCQSVWTPNEAGSKGRLESLTAVVEILQIPETHAVDLEEGVAERSRVAKPDTT